MSVFKNREKTRRRQRGTGQRGTTGKTGEFGPASSGASTLKAVNFYGHFSPGRAARLRRFAARVRAAEDAGRDAGRGAGAGVEFMKRIYGSLPTWLRQRVTGR